MGDNIKVESGFFTKTLASKEMELGSSSSSNLVHFQRMIPQHVDNDGVPQDAANARPIPVADVGLTGAPLVQFFVNDAVTNAIVDYSSAAGSFVLQPGASATWRVREITTHILGGVLVNMGYGSLVALTNGIIVQMKNASGVIANLVGGIALKRHEHWERIGATVTEHANSMSAVLQFKDAIRLRGASGEYLQVTLNDDFSAATEHYFLGRGVIE